MRPFLAALVLLALGLGPPAPGRALPSDEDSPATRLELRALRGPKADVAALLLGGRESGSLRGAALAVAGCPGPPGDDGSRLARVDLHVELEAASLLDAVESHSAGELPDSARLELYVYAISEARTIVASLNQWVRLPIVDLTAQGAGGGVKLATRLDLPPGEYQLRVMAREAGSQRFALRLLGIAVPTADQRKPLLAPPSFGDRAERWLIAREAGGEGAPFPASALPVLAPGRPADLRITGCRLDNATFGARLLTATRKAVERATVQLTPAPSSRQEIPASIEITNVEPGLYLLELSAQSSSGRSSATLPVFVIPSDGDAAPTWTALGGESAGPAPGEIAPHRAADDDAEAAAKPVEAYAQAYLRILETLSLGRLEDAVAGLRGLESRASADDRGGRALRWLAQGQNSVTRDLLRRDPESLLPLLMLHLELQYRYAAEGGVDSELANATRTRIRSLAQVYAAEAKSDMAPALASRSLVELSEALAESGLLVSALTVLREALILDPTNPRAILDIAYQYEHHGLHADSIRMLERLLELAPRSDEGRLRLAMGRLRSGRERDAEQLLSSVIADGTVDWVLAVAYQELARLLIRRERFEEALGLLGTAVVRLPEVQRLYLELAYALDRAGRRAAGQETVARLPPASDRPSPRLLYRLPPRGQDAGPASDLRRHGMARLPQLASALARIGRPG